MKRAIILTIMLSAFAFCAFAAQIGGIKPVHPVTNAPAVQPSGHPKTAPGKPSLPHTHFLRPKAIKALPDLVVEKIWLERGYITFSVKNAGKGSIPDEEHKNGKVDVTYSGKTQTYAFTQNLNGNPPIDPLGVLKKPGKFLSFTTRIKPAAGPKTSHIFVTVFVDSTLKIPEQNEKNTKTVLLRVPSKMTVLAKTAEIKKRKTEKPLRRTAKQPELAVERIYLKNGTLHVQLKNRGRTRLATTDLGSVRLMLTCNGRTFYRRIFSAGVAPRFLQPRCTFNFGTGIRIKTITNVTARLEGAKIHLFKTAKLVPHVSHAQASKTAHPITARNLPLQKTGVSHKGSVKGIPRDLKFNPKIYLPPLQIVPHNIPNLQRARDVFGESNDTFETAYHLDLGFFVGKIYRAAFHNEDDVDWYSFTVPDSGLGSWVQITVDTIGPAGVRLSGIFLQGPKHGGLESLSDTSHARLWAAFYKGVTGYLGIEPNYSQLEDTGRPLDYNIVLQYGVIPDADTSMGHYDFRNAHTELTLNTPRQAYMAAVCDEEENEIGAWDWFIYHNYKRCTNYCVQLSKKGLIILQNPEGGSSADEGEAFRYCMNDNNARADCTPPLRIGIRYKETGFSGTGSVPERYKSPYTITLTEEGQASNDINCQP